MTKSGLCANSIQNRDEKWKRSFFPPRRDLFAHLADLAELVDINCSQLVQLAELGSHHGHWLLQLRGAGQIGVLSVYSVWGEDSLLKCFRRGTIFTSSDMKWGRG